MHQYSNNTATKMELAFHQTHIFSGSRRASLAVQLQCPLFTHNFPPTNCKINCLHSQPGVPCTILTKRDPAILDCESHSHPSHLTWLVYSACDGVPFASLPTIYRSHRSKVLSTAIPITYKNSLRSDQRGSSGTCP